MSFSETKGIEEKTKKEKAERFLNAYHVTERRYLYAVRKLETLKADVYLLSSPKLGERVQSSHEQDKLTNKLFEIEDQKKKVIELGEESNRLKRRTKRMIGNMPGRYEYQTLLTERFLNGEKWQTIIYLLGYSKSQTFRLRDQALLAFYDKYKKQIESQ